MWKYVLIILVLLSSPVYSQNFQNGDVNCDGDVNILDITSTISYLYTGGEPPCDNPPDTVMYPIEGDWLRFSAYMASIDFVKTNYPDYSGFHFSTIGEFCDYGTGTPAGRSGFQFIDQGDGIYLTKGYIFEHVIGPLGFVWAAAEGQPADNTYSYNCTLHYDGDGVWSLVDIVAEPSGDYIRDTRHD